MLLWLIANTVFIADENGETISQEIPLPSVVTGDYGAAFVKMFLTLLALIFLLYATYWFLRKFIHARLQRGVGVQSIKILEKRMISPKSILYLVEVEGQKVLLAESHLEIRRLQNWPQSVELEEHEDRSTELPR